ncbi:unnamed protein product [Nezara viridula]|uniref:N-terminal Ras-GEF domain-containing protein n=1 Tax=Nezara viridula TaxID=85310 RepID=A0A9P0HR86_NEZVI|nr:unnamed protein product [Nezara viridula]
MDPEAVVYREGNLVSGRLEALIQHMVPTNDYYPDRAFLFAFLLTSRLFVKPHDLLGQILALTESQLKAKQASPKERAALLPRLVQLIGEWSETFPYDFRDERVMSHVREVAVNVEGAARQEVSLLLHNLLYRLKKLEQYEAFLHSIHTEATTNSIEALSQGPKYLIVCRSVLLHYFPLPKDLLDQLDPTKLLGRYNQNLARGYYANNRQHLARQVDPPAPHAALTSPLPCRFSIWPANTGRSVVFRLTKV